MTHRTPGNAPEIVKERERKTPAATALGSTAANSLFRPARIFVCLARRMCGIEWIY